VSHQARGGAGQARLAGWLAPRGLTFNEDKTRVVSLDEGLDFLGFTVRRQSGKLLIKPSKAALRRIRERLRTEMHALRGANAVMVLVRLNPIIRGWAAYYRTGVSSEAFSALDRYLWRLTYKWANHGHANKSKHWIVNRYFDAFNKSRRDRWVFGDRDSGAYLTKFAWTGIVRHRMVKGGSSPDDPALAQYWADRRRRGAPPPMDQLSLRLMKTQAGRCPCCGNLLLHADHPPQTPREWEQWVRVTGEGAAQAEPHLPEARRVRRDHQPPAHTRSMSRKPTGRRDLDLASLPCQRAFGACLSRMRGKVHVRF
jgi:RNA-directed DNA polymerase